MISIYRLDTELNEPVVLCCVRSESNVSDVVDVLAYDFNIIYST